MQPPTHPASEYPTYTLKGFSLAPGENARIHRLAFLPPRARTARMFLFLPSLGRETRSYIFLLAFPRRGKGDRLRWMRGKTRSFCHHSSLLLRIPLHQSPSATVSTKGKLSRTIFRSYFNNRAIFKNMPQTYVCGTVKLYLQQLLPLFFLAHRAKIFGRDVEYSHSPRLSFRVHTVYGTRIGDEHARCELRIAV